MIQVGDSVFIVKRNSKQKPFFDTITKVGRKYFYTGRGLKFEIENWKSASDFGQYSIFLSEEEYLEGIKKSRLWTGFVGEYTYTVPPCTLDELISAIKILRGN